MLWKATNTQDNTRWRKDRTRRTPAAVHRIALSMRGLTRWLENRFSLELLHQAFGFSDVGSGSGYDAFFALSTSPRTSFSLNDTASVLLCTSVQVTCVYRMKGHKTIRVQHLQETLCIFRMVMSRSIGSVTRYGVMNTNSV